MCNACQELSKVWDASQQLMVVRFTNRNTGHPTFLLVQGNTDPQSVTIAVKYCPWCGERLIGGADNAAD